MNRKRSALAALAVAAAGVALLAAALVLRGFPERGAVIDAVAPIATLGDSGADETAGDALVPGDHGGGFLPVPAPLDDSRVVDAVAPLAKLSCLRDDPAGDQDDTAAQDAALDAPLASWPADAQRTAAEPLVTAALAPLTALPSSQSERTAAAADLPVDCPPLLREQFNRLQTGEPQSLCQFRGKVLLVVNTASYCAYTDQYEGLEAMYRKYRDRGFVVLGFPCNQFGQQEPGSADEIAAFCRNTYRVGFPMFDKVEVNGPGRHPLYAALARVEDADGVAGDVQWNFEKFLVAPGGTSVQRFRPGVDPEDPRLVAAIEAVLPAS